jgi:hypothetical protein
MARHPSKDQVKSLIKLHFFGETLENIWEWADISSLGVRALPWENTSNLQIPA